MSLPDAPTVTFKAVKNHLDTLTESKSDMNQLLKSNYSDLPNLSAILPSITNSIRTLIDLNTCKLTDLRSNLTQAITDSATLASPILTHISKINKFTLLTSTGTNSDSNMDTIVTDLSSLCILRARIESAKVALEDAQRWESLAQTISNSNDPATATDVYASAFNDLNHLAAFISDSERQRRNMILLNMKSVLWTRLSTQLDNVFVDSCDPLNSAMCHQVATLFRLATKCNAQSEFISQYATIRINGIHKSPPSEILPKLTQLVENDFTTLPLPPTDKMAIVLALISISLTTFSLPDDPSGDVLILARLERILGSTSNDVRNSLAPLLDRIANFHMRSDRLATAALDTLFDRIPMTSFDATLIDTVWRTQIAPAALGIASKVIAQYRGVCGPFRIKTVLAPVVRKVWTQMCLYTVKAMQRIHILDMTARASGGEIHAPKGLDLASSAVWPDHLGRYAAAISMVHAITDRAKTVMRELDLAMDWSEKAAMPVSVLLAKHLQHLDTEEPTDLPMPNLVELTADVGTASLNHIFEYLLAPITASLTHSILVPLYKPPPPITKPDSPRVKPKSRPSTPQIINTGVRGSNIDSNVKPELPPTSPPPISTIRASMVQQLPQFRKWPSPSATALGEYLLQFPHYLESINTNPEFPGSVAFAFAQDAKTAVGKLTTIPKVDDGLMVSHDVLEAIAICTQLILAHSVTSRMDQALASLPPGAIPSDKKGLDAPSMFNGSLAPSLSTGRLASFMSSTFSGLPSSLNMRTGLSEFGGNSMSVTVLPHQTFSPTTKETPLIPPLPVEAREQLAQDLAYLGNVLTALDTPPRLEYLFITALIENKGDIPVADTIALSIEKDLQLDNVCFNGRTERLLAIQQAIVAFSKSKSVKLKSGKETLPNESVSEALVNWWYRCSSAAIAMFPISSSKSE